MTPASRLFAALIALDTWAGIFLYAQADFAGSGSVLASAWTLLFYFTILANIIVAVLFTGMALGAAPFAAPRPLAGITLSMVLVFIVYALLLSDIPHLTAGSELANWLLHRISPVLVAIYWLLFVPKGHLRFSDPFLWTLFPLAYSVYGLVRGGIEGKYPYPFMDVGQLGWSGALVNMAIIAVCFVVFGYLVVALDRALARRAATAP